MNNPILEASRQQRRSPRRRSDELLTALQPFARVIVLMHDNPDPDAIASGWAVKHLVEERQDKKARLVGGGAIVRAENRHMVRLLDPPLELTEQLTLEPETAVVLVDCGVEAVNHLAIEPSDIVAVIDHHQSDRSQPVVPFIDVRPRLAASATIAATYLREQGLEPDPYLATALMYALRSETRGNQTYYSSTDRSILPWLTRLADPQMLAEIEDAPLPISYYGDLVLALQSTFCYRGVAFCMLPRAAGAEIVGEVADLLIRCDDVHRVLCGAVVADDVVVSVRTDQRGGNAAKLVQRLLTDLGRGGGHSHRAGGQIAGVASDGRVPDRLHESLLQRWLTICGAMEVQATRLIPRREIEQNLS